MLEWLPIRWRLALTSSLLTFAILCTFAFAVGELTQSRIRNDFRQSVAATADQLQARTVARRDPFTGEIEVPMNVQLLADAERGVVRVVSSSGAVLLQTRGAPDLDRLRPASGAEVVDGYIVETRAVRGRPDGHPAFVQYIRPLSELDETLRKVRFFLLAGVVGGTALAFFAGLMLASRAMQPIARLTAAADEIRRTRDPGRRIATSGADDEVTQLGRTLDRMLCALDESQSETEAMLTRQREFVADASHELRTPLTSVLANLELLCDTLDGDQAEAARSALRSSQRMRRLVSDLLLLARADARREQPHRPVDLGEVLVEAAGELGTVGRDHEVTVEAESAWVDGVRDDLHRVALNLMENALRHTPPGTHVGARVTREGDDALLVVEDDGPGVPAELRERAFDRFVRGAGDRGGSFGLGLSIVRAVAEQHGGSVRVQDAEPGARFVVRVPLAATQQRHDDAPRGAVGAGAAATPS